MKLESWPSSDDIKKALEEDPGAPLRILVESTRRRWEYFNMKRVEEGKEPLTMDEWRWHTFGLEMRAMKRGEYGN